MSKPPKAHKISIPYDYIPASSHVSSEAFHRRQRARMRAAVQIKPETVVPTQVVPPSTKFRRVK